MSGSLLDPAFVKELEALRTWLRIGTRSGYAGAVTSPRRGGAAEFEEHRAYGPGDDAARVDWLAFARTGQPFVKLYRADEDAVVRVVVDASASLAHGEPSKFEVARRIAAAVSYMALASSERAGLVIATGDGITVSPARRGRGALPVLLTELARARAAGVVDLAETVGKACRGPGRPGLLVVVSDFMDPGPVTDALRRARAAGHDLSLVQVLAPEELDPEPSGDSTLVDSESGEAVELTLDSRTIAAYRARLDALIRDLTAFARAQGGGYVLARTTEPLRDVVRRIVHPYTARGAA